MGKVLDYLHQSGLPPEEYVVIGSGLLDAYGLRESSDVDIAVSPRLFDELRQQPGFVEKERDGAPYLERDPLEVWLGWMKDISFNDLKKTAVVVEGVQFANPKIIIKRKQERGLPKDVADIQMLQEYLHRG